VPHQIIGKPTVYVETSIISYLTGRPSRDTLIREDQGLTRRWWEQRRHLYRLFVSPQVIEESASGDASAAERRLKALAGLESLVSTLETEELVGRLRRALIIPDKSAVDAFHLAFAVIYELDYLLTWNCTHLANAQTLRLLADFCRAESLWLPIICTPREMLPERKVE
jgi:predicted nucleic acid-binding protein